MKRRLLIAAGLAVLLALFALLLRGVLAWTQRLSPVERQVVGDWENRSLPEPDRRVTFTSDRRFVDGNGMTGTWDVTGNTFAVEWDGRNRWLAAALRLAGQRPPPQRLTLALLEPDRMELRAGRHVWVLTRVVPQEAAP